jgi:predicted anti-sigma-YlaC factor YlaD
MNCETYQMMLSDFIDKSLSAADSAAVSDHLLVCDTCHYVHLELSNIVSCCRELRGLDDASDGLSASQSNFGQLLM